MNDSGSSNFDNPQGGASQPTQMICPSCGKPNAVNSTFCNSCGSRLSHGQAQPGQTIQLQPQQPYPTYAPPQQPPPQPPQYPPGQTTVVYPPQAQQPYHYQQPPPHYPSQPSASSNMTVVMQSPQQPQQAYARPYVPQKSVGLAVLLAFLFGPLGMFYSTIGGAITMLLSTCALTSGIFLCSSLATGADELGNYYDYSGVVLLVSIVGYIFFEIICMVWAGMAASSHNRRAMMYR